MTRRPGAVYVATTSRTCKAKLYQSRLPGGSCREGGKVKHQTFGDLAICPTCRPI